VNVGFLDGTVRFVKDSVNWQTWAAISTRAGSEVVDASSYGRRAPRGLGGSRWTELASFISSPSWSESASGSVGRPDRARAGSPPRHSPVHDSLPVTASRGVADVDLRPVAGG
jgi:hypothetical protein